MAITEIKIISKVIEDVVTTQYIVDASMVTITKADARNVGATNATFTISLVNGTGGEQSFERNIRAGESVSIGAIVGHNLSNGDSIKTDSSAGATIQLRVTGRKIQ